MTIFAGLGMTLSRTGKDMFGVLFDNHHGLEEGKVIEHTTQTKGENTTHPDRLIITI